MLHRTPHFQAMKLFAKLLDEKLATGSRFALTRAQRTGIVTLLYAVHRATASDRAVIARATIGVLGAVGYTATKVVASAVRLALDVFKAVAAKIRVLGAVRVGTTNFLRAPVSLCQGGFREIPYKRCASHSTGDGLHRLTAAKLLVSHGLRNLIEPVCHFHLLVIVQRCSKLVCREAQFL